MGWYQAGRRPPERHRDILAAVQVDQLAGIIRDVEERVGRAQRQRGEDGVGRAVQAPVRCHALAQQHRHPLQAVVAPGVQDGTPIGRQQKIPRVGVEGD